VRSFVMCATLCFSCRTWVISKKFLLVCDIFELWFSCFLFVCVLAQKGRILRDTGPDSPDILTGVSGLIPEVSGSS